ncbi:MAG: PDZ domain-containing protein [Planctomycetes bacterium]|nr:PDZ domain-containing protein [Planctomycetota bacterium]
MRMARRLAVVWVVSLCPACSFCVPIGSAGGRLPFGRFELTPVEVPSRTGGGEPVRGLLVKDPYPPFEVRSLRDGDVILSVNGTSVQDRRALEDVERELGPVRRVRIGVLRGGEATDVETTTHRVGPYFELVLTVLPPFLAMYPGMPKTLLDIGDDERYRSVGPLLSVAWGPELHGMSLLGLVWFEADPMRGLWTYWVGPVVLCYERDKHPWGGHRFPTVHRVIG